MIRSRLVGAGVVSAWKQTADNIVALAELRAIAPVQARSAINSAAREQRMQVRDGLLHADQLQELVGHLDRIRRALGLSDRDIRRVHHALGPHSNNEPKEPRP